MSGDRKSVMKLLNYASQINYDRHVGKNWLIMLGRKDWLITLANGF